MYLPTFLKLLCLCFISNLIYGQPYPQDYFRSPINGPMKVIGTFGELRSNHFHAGLDLKGPVGQTLYAIAEGYISRIKIEKGGYGKAIYINHPNGYTSVYAHVDKFTPEIEAFVRQNQKRLKKFEVNLYPRAHQFKFQKGDTVGKMGMRGYAFGPHLHFEIRETKSEKPVNPLLFGLNYADNVKPRLHELKVYALNPQLHTLFTKTFNLIQRGDYYKVSGDTLSIGAWRVGLGIKAYDHMNGVPNWNGIYRMEMFVDGEMTYSFDFEKYSFNETRYINAHMDYEEQRSKKSYFNRCYRLPGNKLSIYNEAQESGVIQLSISKVKEVKMVIKDYHGNTSETKFWLKRKAVEPPNFPGTYNYFLPHKEQNVIKTGTAEFDFPAGTFYEDIYMQLRTTQNGSGSCYSHTYHVHDPLVPVHKYYRISLTPVELPQKSLDKAFIAYCDEDNRFASYGGAWQNGRLQAKVRDFGDFCIMIDETPPTVRPVHFKTDMRGYNKMSFKIRDNVEVKGRAEDLNYEAWIDGKWVVFEYDLKSDLIFHQFEEQLPKGKHDLVLKVWDDRGNETTFKRQFTR